MYSYDYLQCPDCKSKKVTTQLGGEFISHLNERATWHERSCSCGAWAKDVTFLNMKTMVETRSISPYWKDWECSYSDLRVSRTKILNLLKMKMISKENENA